MNKILVRVYVPAIEKNYEIWIPLNKRIRNAIVLIIKMIADEEYNPKKIPNLYNKESGEKYDLDSFIQQTNIRNATELILI